MAGTQKFELIVAGPEHNPDILRIYHSIHYEMDVDVHFLRGEHPYHSIMTEGKDGLIILMRNTENNEIAGMGACCIHEMYIDGKIKNVGYLNGLKVLPEYAGKNFMLPRAFARMGELLQGRVDLCIGSMIKDEEETIKFFEKRRKKFPTYVKQDGYRMFCFKTQKMPKGIDIKIGDPNQVEAFYRQHAPEHNLRTTGFIRGTSSDNTIVLEKNGEIKGMCCLLNMQKDKNYYLKGYHGKMRILSHMPTKLMGYPGFPTPGRNVNAITISMLTFAPDVSIEERKQFICGASSLAGDVDMLMMALAESDLTFEAMKLIKSISFDAFLYTINWNEDQTINDRPIYFDPALV